MDDHKTAIEAASKLYRYDLRARQIIDMCVAKGLQDRGEGNPYGRDFDRHAAEVATEAVACLLRYIYDNDGEIGRLAVERDHYKRLAEEALRFAPIQPLVLASVDTQPKAGDALAAPLVSGAVPQADAPNPQAPEGRDDGE